MQPLVQSAIDAANRGENQKALELCRQALTVDPNDVDAWLVTAAVVDQPERKRQCLNRVLALDPTNQIAHDELLEMDRAEMGGEIPFAAELAAESYEGEPFSEPAHPFESFPANPASHTSGSESGTSQAESQVVTTAPKTRAEKLVFQYPVIWRILVYALIPLFICAGVVIAFQNVIASLLFFALAGVAAFGILVVSPKVETNNWGIRVSNLFSRAELKWSHIESMKLGTRPDKLELYKSNGQFVKIPARINGYPRLVEIIREKRPDLFETNSASAQEK